MSRAPLVLLAILGACVTGDAEGPRIQPTVNSVLESPDLTEALWGETYAVVGQASPGAPVPDSITLTAYGGDVGFGRAYSVAEWEALLAGEPLMHSRPIAEVGVRYEDRDGRTVSRSGVSERITQLGPNLVWVIEFGPGLNNMSEPIPGTTESTTMTVTFTPLFRCRPCNPRSSPGTCILAEDPMAQSDFCRGAIERFNLVEHGFVDPSLLEL